MSFPTIFIATFFYKQDSGVNENKPRGRCTLTTIGRLRSTMCSCAMALTRGLGLAPV